MLKYSILACFVFCALLSLPNLGSLDAGGTQLSSDLLTTGRARSIFDSTGGGGAKTGLLLRNLHKVTIMSTYMYVCIYIYIYLVINFLIVGFPQYST